MMIEPKHDQNNTTAPKKKGKNKKGKRLRRENLVPVEIDIEDILKRPREDNISELTGLVFPPARTSLCAFCRIHVQPSFALSQNRL